MLPICFHHVNEPLLFTDDDSGREIRLRAPRLPEGDALVPQRGLRITGQDGLHRVHQGAPRGKQGAAHVRSGGSGGIQAVDEGRQQQEEQLQPGQGRAQEGLSS